MHKPVMRRIGIVLVVALVLGAGAFLFFGPGLVDRQLNQVVDREPPPPLDREDRGFHDMLFVADLHADPLLWQRDLLVEADHGHVDVPRLIAGGVALQVFGVPTQVPSSINYDENELDLDVVTALAVAQGWPMATWRSPLQRALHLADELQRTADASGERFRIIRSNQDLDLFVADRAASLDRVAGLLAIEGLHALEGDLDNVDVLFAAGYRMMGLMHFFDNRLGGSAHGISKAGLSEFGRQVVERMQERRIVVDLAHASPKMIDDILAMATAPVVVSHTGVKGTCDHIRNLSDEHIRGVAETGGVVGIGYWDAAICDVDVDGIVRAIRYTADLVGADHVGLGSDFDGATTTPFDTAGIPYITRALTDAGFHARDVRKIMGGNVLRVLAATLPPNAG